MVSELFSLFIIILLWLWDYLILLDSLHLFSCLHRCHSQVLFFLQVLLVLHAFLLLCTLFDLNFCLSFCDIQRVNDVSEGLIYCIVLEHSAVSADSHVDRNGVASGVFPVGNTRWYFKILHVLFGQLSRGRTMERRRRWSRPWRQFPMFMLCRQKRINLYSINSNDPFLGALASLALRGKLNHFRLRSAQLLNVGPKCSLFLNAQNIIYFLPCTSYNFLILFSWRLF